MAVSFKGAHFPKDIILMGVRWYVAYLLSYRHVEELMEEGGVEVDHSTIQRWVVKYSPPPGRGVPSAQASGVGQLEDG
jgi:transposase-like protein